MTATDCIPTTKYDFRGEIRKAWEAVNGKKPHGLHLHHDCPNRECKNVEHLQLLTHAEHVAVHQTASDYPHGPGRKRAPRSPFANRPRLADAYTQKEGRTRHRLPLAFIEANTWQGERPFLIANLPV